MNTPSPRPSRGRASRGSLTGLSLAVFILIGQSVAQTVNPETLPAPGYENPPAIESLGGLATVAAYSPPHEQLEDPSDDADEINDNRTRQNFTRPIYLTPEHFNAAGNPLKPVDTTNWWTDVLMGGDGGTLWQYPITAKFIPSGIDLQQIVGPETSATPGDYPKGFVTGGLLRVEAIEKPANQANPDILVADFEGNGPNLPSGWFISTVPGASGTVVLLTDPVKNVAESPGTDPTGFTGERFLISKNAADINTPRGMVTSAAFTASRSYLHYQIAGAISPDLRVELVNDSGTVVASQPRDAGATATLTWQKFDITGLAGQNLRFRMVDNSTGAWICIDQILLSNEALSPAARPGSRVLSATPLVRDWSDWMVKVRKTDSANPASVMSMDACLVRNMPFVWLEFGNANPRVSFATGATVVFRDSSGTVLSGGNLGAHEKISVETAGRFYGLHVPAGTVFNYDTASRRLSVALPEGAGSNYMVVSMLPAVANLATLDAYAYARPEKTTVTYAYDPASADGNAVHTTWKYEVTSLKAGADKVLQGWLPPHYRTTGASLNFVSGIEYVTPRGLLRCGEATPAGGFAIDYAFNGILANFAKPELTGLPDGFDPAYMEQLLRSYDATNNGVCDDTYYGAKNLVKHARAMHMAKALGLTDVYANLKAELKASLTDWFTYDGTEQNHYFAHSERWGHIIGHNYVPDFNLAGFTDVHFHYGYYTLAYALLAVEDDQFRDQFKEIAIELARAYANWERPTVMRDGNNRLQFPWMRTFEPMVGHSYAGGSGGNNQESSSESIQAWAGMFLLGEALRGNDPRADSIMAAAAFGYAIETRSVYEYYADYHGSPFASDRRDRNGVPVPVTEANRYDASNGNWPAGFRYGKFAAEYPSQPAWIFTNGIMTDGGNSFANYFSGEPAHTYGIQWLPNAPHMMFLARDPQFIAGQFNTLFKYRGAHFAVDDLNPLRSSMKNLRAKWYSAPTADNPDQRVVAIDEAWPTYGMKWAIQTVYDLNPAYARQTANNPLYYNGQWLVTFPPADTKGAKITFPASVWTPDALVANYPHLVPPATEAGLSTYALAQWVAAFHTANGGPGPDFARYKAMHSWDPADYPARDSAASITGLLNAMQDIGGNSWPLIALCYDGFAEPEFGLKVMAEYRRLGLSYAGDTESNMFFYNYLSSLKGLGTIQTDQHLAVGVSAVFKDAAGNRSYMVQNKSDSYQLVNVFQAGSVIGQVLAYPRTTSLQHGLLAVEPGFAPVGAVPAANSAGVSVNQDRVVVIFNEPFNPATLDTEVTIAGPGGVSLQYVAGSAPQIAEYRVLGNWTLGGAYTITVPGTVANAAGTRTVGTARTFAFTIQSAFGLQLTSVTPSDGASGVDPGLDTVELSFNSRINPATFTGLSLAGAGSPALTYDAAASSANKAVFRVGSDLQPGGFYTLTVPGSVADVYGQSLGAARTAAFTVRQPDTVLSAWPTTLDWSKYAVLGSSGEAVSTVSGARIWAFDAVGDFVTLQIAAEKGGTYNLKVVYRQNPDRGVIKLLVNNTEVAGKLNNQTLGVTPVIFDFGTVRLEAGQNTLRFEVASKVGAAKPQFSLIETRFTPEQIDVQLVPGPYAESGGRVVFEAEDFGGNTPVTVNSVVRSWDFTTARSGFAGTGAMRSMPNAGVNLTSNLLTTSPRLDFPVSFSTAGTYKVWIRGDAAGGDADDSVHIGLDGVLSQTAKDISLERATSFVWTTKRMFTTAPATLVIPAPGVYTINLWMREDGAYVDRILLSLDQAYVPSGTGPAASERVYVPPANATTAAAATLGTAGTAGTTGTAYNGVTTLTFAQTGVYDYLLAPDIGGEALITDYLFLPTGNANEYVSFDGSSLVGTLPGYATPYDVMGDASVDYYDVFSFDQELPPLPKTNYNLGSGVFTIQYRKGASGFGYQLYYGTDGVNWTAANMSLETYSASTGFHQYAFPWTRSSNLPLFIRVQVTQP